MREGSCLVEGCNGRLRPSIQWGNGYEWVAPCSECKREYRTKPTKGEVEAHKREAAARYRPPRVVPLSFPCPLPDCSGAMRYQKIEMLFSHRWSDYDDDYLLYECDNQDCFATMHLSDDDYVKPGEAARRKRDLTTPL